MPSNLFLLLPILGGYFFTHFCYLTKFRAQRLEGHRLILESALSGVVFVMLARAAILWVYPTKTGQYLHVKWERVAGETPFLGTLCLGMACSLAAPLILNFLMALYLRVGGWGGGRGLLDPARMYWMGRAISEQGNSLLRLIYQSLDTYDLPHPMLVTLKSQKVYLGLVAQMPSRNEDRYLRILPWKDGHLEKDTLAIEFDVEHPILQALSSENLDDFVVVLPFDDILSAGFCSEEDRNKFSSLMAQAGQSPDETPSPDGGKESAGAS